MKDAKEVFNELCDTHGFKLGTKEYNVAVKIWNAALQWGADYIIDDVEKEQAIKNEKGNL